MGIREVAQRAGVAMTTAWRVIHGIPTVDRRVVQRVRKAAADLRYFPSSPARALASGKSRILGVIVPEITNPFFPEIVQSFEDAAVERDYEILLISTLHDPKRVKLGVRRLLERRVNGIAILTFGMEDLLVRELRFHPVPSVVLDLCRPEPWVTTIRIDYLHGARQSVQHLAALRHRCIAFIAGPEHLSSASARREAFEQCMTEIGLTARPKFLVAGDNTVEGGMRAFANLAALSTPPTAVLCSNVLSALGVMRQAFQTGISIPSALSVIGFDDIRLARFTVPPLTTVRISQTELARLAFQVLIERIEKQPSCAETSERILTTNLVLRCTTALCYSQPGNPEQP